jgi:hypothetical protein
MHAQRLSNTFCQQKVWTFVYTGPVFGAASNRFICDLKPWRRFKAKKKGLRWTNVTESCPAIFVAVQETPGVAMTAALLAGWMAVRAKG